MLMKVCKTLWVMAAIAILLATLNFYDGKELSDVWVFLTWLMLILSFPTGTLVSLAHFLIGDLFATTIKTSYLSLGVEWVVYFTLGYVQWFVLLPWLWRKWKSRRVS